MQASREQQLEQDLLNVRAELAAVKARAREEISAQEREILRLANKNACQEAMIGHLRWKVEMVMAEGRRLEEAAKKESGIMAAVMHMGKEELSTRVLPLVHWIAETCNEARIHLDLDGLARQLTGGGNALYTALETVKKEVVSKVQSAPGSCRDKRKFLDGLLPCPPIPGPTLVPPSTSQSPAVISQVAPDPAPIFGQSKISCPRPAFTPKPTTVQPLTPIVPAVIPAPISLTDPAPVANTLTTRAFVSTDKDEEDRVISGKNRRRLQ